MGPLFKNKVFNTCTFKTGPLCSPETSVINQRKLRNDTEDGRVHVLIFFCVTEIITILLYSKVEFPLCKPISNMREWRHSSTYWTLDVAEWSAS
jgi:hypothetical protein